MNTKAHVKGQIEEPTKASKGASEISADSEQRQSAPEQLAASQVL